MKGRDALRELMNGKAPEPSQLPPKRSSGAIRAVSLDLQHLSDEAASARSLRQTLASGDAVIELAAADIDPSPVADRIPVDDDPAFAELKAAIADKGQQVPILVRPHPERSGRFQIAYGRRRLRAALELGVAVKAVVRQLSDRDLVIAQAQENGPRADLTFIERALFATNLSAHGFDRDTITVALGVDKPELSRLLTVAAAVTPKLIGAIGPAPKIGRPRWLLLAEKCEEASARLRVAKIAESEQFKAADTNGRFNIVLAALRAVDGAVERKAALDTNTGQRVAWVERTKKGIRISSDEPLFSAFLERRLPALLLEFEAGETRSELHAKKGDR
jgi:ParB family chromosome partitioning protein